MSGSVSSPLRAVPPLVGLVVEHSIVTPNTTASDSNATSNYDPRIMHTAISAELEQWVVTVDASDDDIARALDVPHFEVRTNWLTSRTPLVDPRPPPSAFSRYREGRTRAAPVPLSQIQKFRDLAVELRARLKDVAVENGVITTPIRPSRRKDRYYASVAVPPVALSIERESSPDSAPSDVGSFEPLSHLSVAAETASSSTVGSGIELLEIGRYVKCTGADGVLVRGSGGLYSGVRHGRGLAPGECAYIELYVQYAGGQGGLAIGACTSSYALDTMVGGKLGSVALHSEARVVRAGHWSDASGGYCARFGSGDTVGVLMSVSKRGRVLLRISVNGAHAGEVVGDETMRQAAADGARTHIQVSMFRPGARVALRDSPQDWKFDTSSSRPLWKPHRLGGSEDVGSQVLTP